MDSQLEEDFYEKTAPLHGGVLSDFIDIAINNYVQDGDEETESTIADEYSQVKNELTDGYWEAYKTAEERIKDVTYTYEELFGSLVE